MHNIKTIFTKTFFLQYWNWFSFFILVIICLSNLLFSEGIYGFTDSGFYYRNIDQTTNMALSKLGQFSNTDGFSFGFDNSTGSFSSLISSWYQFLLTFLFGTHYGQVLFYFFFYLITFIYSLKLYKKIFPEVDLNIIYLASLFTTFNPFALLIITLFSTGYVYALTPFFIYHILKYIEKRDALSLILIITSGLFFLSYLRLIPIIFLLFIIFFILFGNRLNLTSQFKPLTLIAILLFLAAFPFVINTALTFTQKSNLVGNYMEGFNKFEVTNYNFKSSFLNSFSYTGGFTPSALSHFYNPEGRPGLDDHFSDISTTPWYKIIQILFNVGILVFAIFLFKKTRQKKLLVSTTAIILIIISINTFGAFSSLESFIAVHTSLFIFLYNDYGFIQFIQVFLYSILIIIIGAFFSTDLKKFKLLFFSFILLFLFINTTPYISNFYGFKKIPNTPSEYKIELFEQNINTFSETSLFMPYHWMKFSWAPYRTDLNFIMHSKFKSFIAPNLRIISQDTASFYNEIYNNLNNPNLSNLSILNFKHFFLFKNVDNANESIDSYNVLNIADRVPLYFSELSQNEKLLTVTSNEEYTQYSLINADEYDFSIYPVGVVSEVNRKNFFDNTIDIERRPALINEAIKPEFLSILQETTLTNNESKVAIKASIHDSNMYLIKISNIKVTGSLVLQFNQMFSSSWKMFFINEDIWNMSSCISNWQNFTITNNSKCQITGNPINSLGITIQNREILPPELHDRGNYIGNIFLLTPEVLERNIDSNGEIYAVIYFQKQYYYMLSLSVTLAVLISLLLFIIFVQIRKRIYV